ncbi:hypothetical protein [Bacillus cereus]|uniref:hypothetical protein n=1 Tax=Bacillus cereus TaxID=1396 RepID=UPI00201D881E|nr:hypothetical protein [Bacillus cereus]
MGVSLVCAMLVRGSVLNFGLLQDFTVDYLILFLNEGNAKFLIFNMITGIISGYIASLLLKNNSIRTAK